MAHERHGEDGATARFEDLLGRYGAVVDGVVRGRDDSLDEYRNTLGWRDLIQDMLDAGFRPDDQSDRALNELDGTLRGMLTPVLTPLSYRRPETAFWYNGLPRNMAGEMLADAVAMGHVSPEWSADR